MTAWANFTARPTGILAALPSGTVAVISAPGPLWDRRRIAHFCRSIWEFMRKSPETSSAPDPHPSEH